MLQVRKSALMLGDDVLVGSLAPFCIALLCPNREPRREMDSVFRIDATRSPNPVRIRILTGMNALFLTFSLQVGSS